MCDILTITMNPAVDITTSTAFVAPMHKLKCGAPRRHPACLDLVVTVQPAPRYGVASGSLPPGVPPDFYARLATWVQSNGAKLVLDTSVPALAAAF